MSASLADELLVEASSLVSSDPTRSARLRSHATAVRRMEVALDEIVEANREAYRRQAWLDAARNGKAVVYRGIFSDQNVETGRD